MLRGSNREYGSCDSMGEALQNLFTLLISQRGGCLQVKTELYSRVSGINTLTAWAGGMRKVFGEISGRYGQSVWDPRPSWYVQILHAHQSGIVDIAVWSRVCHCGVMTHLLVIHHCPTESTEQLLDAAIRGANHPDIEGVKVTSRPALAWARGEEDETAIKQADGYLFVTPANFGYMSGALKHVFDSTFLKIGGSLNADGSAGDGSKTVRRLYGLIVHGRYDTTGAVRSVESIVGALGWRLGGETLEAMGDVTEDHLTAAEDLGATLAVQLME